MMLASTHHRARRGLRRFPPVITIGRWMDLSAGDATGQQVAGWNRKLGRPARGRLQLFGAPLQDPLAVAPAKPITIRPRPPDHDRRRPRAALCRGGGGGADLGLFKMGIGRFGAKPGGRAQNGLVCTKLGTARKREAGGRSRAVPAQPEFVPNKGALCWGRIANFSAPNHVQRGLRGRRSSKLVLVGPRSGWPELGRDGATCARARAPDLAGPGLPNKTHANHNKAERLQN